jgi:hypothetical protein
MTPASGLQRPREELQQRTDYLGHNKMPESAVRFLQDDETKTRHPSSHYSRYPRNSELP